MQPTWHTRVPPEGSRRKKGTGVGGPCSLQLGAGAGCVGRLFSPPAASSSSSRAARPQSACQATDHCYLLSACAAVILFRASCASRRFCCHLLCRCSGIHVTAMSAPAVMSMPMSVSRLEGGWVGRLGMTQVTLRQHLSHTIRENTLTRDASRLHNLLVATSWHSVTASPV